MLRFLASIRYQLVGVPTNMDKLLKKLPLIITALLLGLLILWVHGHGFIEISVTGGNGGNFDYTISRQDGSKPVEISTDKTSIKRFLPRGSYQISVTASGNSHVAISKITGNLRTEKVDGTLRAEKARQFVGDNPAPCMYYIGEVLNSGECGDLLKNLNTHVPATASQPTYAVKFTTNGPQEAVEGIVNTKLGSLMLTQPFDEADDSGGGYHTINLLSASLTNPVRKVPLTLLKTDKTYAISAYADGFVVHDTKFTQVLYYSSLSAQPISLPITTPDQNNMIPISITSSPDSVVLYYSTDLISDEVSPDTQSEIVVYQQGKTNHYSVDGQPSSVVGCGLNVVCVLRGKTLEVYSTQSSSLKLLYQLTDIKDVLTLNDSLLVVSAKGVIGLNLVNRSGYYEYTFGKYQYCGSQNVPNGYVLCLINSQHNKVALLIDQSSADTTRIDQKVEKIQADSGIENVSIYKNYIFVTPRVATVFDSSTGTNKYDPAQIITSKQFLGTLLQKSSIDTGQFTVINTVAY